MRARKAEAAELRTSRHGVFLGEFLREERLKVFREMVPTEGWEASVMRCRRIDLPVIRSGEGPISKRLTF